MTAPVTRKACAKINLTLDVGARRADGYHDLRSVMQTIALHDTVTVTRTPECPGVALEVNGPEAEGVPRDASNLVHKAAVRVQKTAAARGIGLAGELGLQIVLTKRIPSQAGLGGGSSDAAATLLAVYELFGVPVELGELTRAASLLGADVAFFLVGGTALVEGIGERVSPLPALSPDWPLVVVKPSVGVSTKAAYDALDAARAGGPPASIMGSREREDGLSSPVPPLLGARGPLANDFQSVILAQCPEIAAVYETLREITAGFVLLCGSGSALFCRASSQAHAARIAENATALGLGKVWTTSTTQGENST